MRFQVKAPSTLSLCWKEARPLLSLKCEQDPSCLVIGGRRFVSFGWRYGTSHSHLSLLIEGKSSYHRFTGLVQKKLFEVFHATSPQFLNFRVSLDLCVKSSGLLCFLHPMHFQRFLTLKVDPWWKLSVFVPGMLPKAWEECLQRRGLAERPGRVELEVRWKLCEEIFIYLIFRQ